MHGTPPLILADIGVPDAWQCFSVAAPFLAIFVLRWIIRGTDTAVERLFPHWEWEKRLGWLNLRAQRRAEAALRWIGYFLYVLLAAALYGILWAAPALGEFNQVDDPGVLADIALKAPVFLISIGLWLVYLGFELIPKLRRQYEADELEKFRATRRSAHPETRRSSPFASDTIHETESADVPARPNRRLGRN